ncbi:zona pellucida-binding protein 2-like isoform X2 [Rhineura floridana]|uniref:zona pellucida-binding protein 2-like isoform X2 n=1 Tax=Rhineura floridana TaxID=261503 RepID=UPI002AC82A46|nr:zona pellucida-binding protein 2-like isoform X2 [Rhineura floridana]
MAGSVPAGNPHIPQFPWRQGRDALQGSRLGYIVLKSGYMSCWSVGLGVVLGVLVLLLCDGAGSGLYLDLYESDNGTSAGLAHVGETVPAAEMDPIFIHVGANEITLPCKPAKMDFVIGMNPTYNWSLENEETHPLHGNASLTLHEFRAEDSGHYACTVSYSKEGQHHTKTFYHTVVGYHIRAELQVLLVFQSKSCDEALTHGFLKTLQEHLSNVVSHLHCDLLFGGASCFPTMEKPLDEFSFQVELEVSPFGKGWDKSCCPKDDALGLKCYHSTVQTNLQQAKEAITTFMENNKHFPLGEPVTSRTSFVNTFFNFLESGKCHKGYGQTEELQAHCPDCCTLCPPGTYSVTAVGNCALCPAGTYSLNYGATICIQCHHHWPTLHPGARTAAECINTKVPPRRRFSVLMVAFALPPLTCLCIIVLCCYCFRRHWQKRDSSTNDGETKQLNEATVLADDKAILDSQEDVSPLLPPPSLEDPDNKGAMFPPPSNLEMEPGGAISPPPVGPEEQPVIEDVVFPPSSPVSDVESA